MHNSSELRDSIVQQDQKIFKLAMRMCNILLLLLLITTNFTDMAERETVFQDFSVNCPRIFVDYVFGATVLR